MTAHNIEQGLVHSDGLSAEARQAFLDGLRHLSSGPNRLSRERLARIYMRTLQCELGRPRADQNEAFQERLVLEMQNLQYRKAYPVFDTLQTRSIFPKVREQASSALKQLRDSVQLMWNETTVDRVSTAQQRANALAKSLEDSNNAEQTVQGIFSAYKGYKVEDARDPGLANLHLAMNDSNERVRLAAAMILIESRLSNEHPTKTKAIQVLVDLTIAGSRTGYREDAYKLLDRLTLSTSLQIKMSSNNRVATIERLNGRIRATECEGTRQVGWIYPNGQSLRVFNDDDGNICSVIENGIEYNHGKVDGRYVDQWRRPDGTIWIGRWIINQLDGSYWYQAKTDAVKKSSATTGVLTNVP